MSQERAYMVAATVSTPIPQGSYCGFTQDDIPISFTAPIDLDAGDVVIVDTRSGQPLGIYREKRIIWRYEPSRVLSGTVTFTMTEDAQATLWAALGMVK